jgi:hypothetical protein
MLKKLLLVLTALVAFQSGEGQAGAFASENGITVCRNCIHHYSGQRPFAVTWSRT